LPLRAAAYVRFSSDNQREESIDAQLRAIAEYAKRNDLIVVKEYADRARSATSDKRPAFQTMIADSGKGLFDVVIVHKLDRFSRDTYDSVIYKRKLRLNGVNIRSVTETLDESPESVILESVLTGMADYFSKNLARETMKGMKENALKCRHTGGTPPLGYSVDPMTKKLLLNEEEAVTVKKIFDLYLNGLGYDQIIRILNDQGMRTKRGQPFGKNSLHDILINEKYAGVYVFNCSASKDMRGKRNNHAQKNAEDIIRIEGGVPAIVTREQFEQVKTKMAKNKRGPGAYKSKEIYLLSGLIFCGECEKVHGRAYAMAGNRHSTKNSDALFVSYRCGNRDRTNAMCGNTELRREYIETYVLHELERRLFNEGNIPILTKKLNEHLIRSNQSGADELQQVHTELGKVIKQIENIVAAVANGSVFQSLLDKMGDLEARQAHLETRAATLKANKENTTVTEDAMRGLFRMFHEAVKVSNIPEIKKFIDGYVQRVVVFRTHVEVTFLVPVPGEPIGDNPLEIQLQSTRNKLSMGSGVVA